MPANLTRQDTESLRSAQPRPRHGRRAAWVTFLTGLGLFAMVVVEAPTRPCTELNPCGPDIVSSLGAGLLLAALAVCWLHPGLAALTAAGAAV